MQPQQIVRPTACGMHKKKDEVTLHACVDPACTCGGTILQGSRSAHSVFVIRLGIDRRH